MLNFCTCGSLIVDGKCSNKKCEHRINSDIQAPKKTRKAATTSRATRKSVSTNSGGSQESDAAEAETVTPKKTPKSSRCVTYSISDLPEAELDNLKLREKAKSVKPGF